MSLRRASGRRRLVTQLHSWHLDVAAKDLSLLLRSRHPLIVCETIEEQRFEALVRAVSSELTIPFWSWSAASGLTPAHPEDADKSADLGFALRLIRRTTGDGTWLLKDPMPHLEAPATLRLLRETAQEFAGSSRTIVLVGPSMATKPELEDVQVRFEFALPGPDELRDLLSRVARRFSRENPAAKVALTRQDAEGIVADLQGLTMFEAERALSRAVVEDNALTAEDRPADPRDEEDPGRGRRPHRVRARAGGARPARRARDAQALDRHAPRRVPAGGGTAAARSAQGNPAARRPGLRQEHRRQGGRRDLGASPPRRWTPGKLLAPFIGESERNLRDALRRVERMAPCVLWIDEIEKAFASGRSSESDGGVSKRLVGTLLTWMQERASQGLPRGDRQLRVRSCRPR